MDAILHDNKCQQFLKRHISTFETFTNDEFEKISSCFRYVELPQKEYLLKEGNVASDIFLIISGLVRVFYKKNGKDITTYLASDESFVSSYSSFLKQTYSFESIQCIEKTECLSISYENMQELYQLFPKWNTIGRILMEENYLYMSKRIFKIQNKPALDRYLDFIQTSPYKMIQNTPMIHIASFLGITPESLSRLKKKIASS